MKIFDIVFASNHLVENYLSYLTIVFIFVYLYFIDCKNTLVRKTKFIAFSSQQTSYIISILISYCVVCSVHPLAAVGRAAHAHDLVCVVFYVELVVVGQLKHIHFA